MHRNVHIRLFKKFDKTEKDILCPTFPILCPKIHYSYIGPKLECYLGLDGKYLLWLSIVYLKITTIVVYRIRGKLQIRGD